MQAFLDLVEQVLAWAIGLLPQSPFTGVITYLGSLPYLGYIAWFLPISQIIATATLWLTAIAIFYFYQVILRWIRLVG